MDDGRSIRVVETTAAVLLNAGEELSSVLAWPVLLIPLVSRHCPWPLSYEPEVQN